MHLTKDMEHVNLCGILWYHTPVDVFSKQINWVLYALIFILFSV